MRCFAEIFPDFENLQVALAKLAKLKEIKVEIDDEIAQAEVIEKHNVNYELLDFLKMGYNMIK